MFKKILIINPFGIGDVLFTTPIIKTLKEVYPAVKIGYLCSGRSKAVLENNPLIDYIFVYDRDDFEKVRKESVIKWLKKINVFLRDIRGQSFEVALDFSLNTQYGFFSWLTGIKERIGFDYKKRGVFLTRRLKLAGYDQKHIVEYYAQFLQYLGIGLKHRNMEFYLNPDDQTWLAALFTKYGIEVKQSYIVVIPAAGKSWGSQAQLKQWSAHNFANLSDIIIEKYKLPIIILGDACERSVVDKVTLAMRQKAIDLCGSTTLGECAALISRAALVITNDGGPLHIAVALGRKTVSFFGPVDPLVYGPYPLDRARHIVLRRDLECSPCYRNFRLKECLRQRECLDKISVREALDAVDALLY